MSAHTAPTSPAQRPRQHVWQSPVSGAILVFALGMGVTAYFAQRVADHTAREVRERFEARGNLHFAHLSRRLDDLENVILSLQGLFIASAQVSRREFHDYAHNLDLGQRLGGLQTLALERRIREAERMTYVAAVRDDRSLDPRGYPNFELRPEGTRPEYLVTDFVEPHAGNEAALGVDSATVAVHADAIESARDSGQFRASPPFKATADPSRSPHLALRAPIYHRGIALLDAASRRQALNGFIVLTIETRTSFGDYFKGLLADGEGLMIADAGPTGTAAADTAGHQNHLEIAQIGLVGTAPALQRETTRDFGGRRWHIQHQVNPAWVAQQPAHLAALRVLGVGATVSLLLALLHFALASGRKRALALAAEKTRALRATLDHMAQGISVFDSDLRLIGHNRRFLELLDFPEELAKERADFADFIQHNAQRGEYGPGEVAAQVRERVELARKFLPHHLLRKRPDGTVLEIIGKPLPGGGMVTTYTDITAQEAARNAVEVSERRYRTLVLMSPDGIFAHRDGTIILANPAAATLLGASSPEDLIGRQVETLIDPLDLERIRQRVALLATGEADHVPLTEVRLQTLDGRGIEVESTGTLIELEGESAVLTVFRDITENKQASRQIQRERDFQQHLIASIPGVFYLFDQNGRFLLWNRNFETVTGSSAEEMARAHPLDFFVDADRELIGNRIGQVFVSGSATAEARFRHKDGSSRPYHFTGERVFLEGNAPALVGVGIDISERVRVQEALEQQTEIMRTTLEHLPQGISLTNAELKMTAMNERYFELLDFPEELRYFGVPIERMFRFNAERGEYGPGDPDALVQARLDQARRFEPHFFKRVRPNGVVLEIRGTPLPGGGFVTTYTDITEQEKAQAALRSSEQRYRSLIDLLPDAIIVHRGQGILLANPAAAQLCGLGTVDDLIGRNILDFVEARFHPLVRERIARLEAVPQAFRLPRSELEFQRGDGSKVPVEGSAIMIALDDGPAIISVLRDLSERKEADQLIRRERDFSRKLIESIPGIFYLFEASGQLVLWNRNLELLLDLPSERLARMSALELYGEEDWSILRRAGRRVIRKGSASLEARLRNRQGELIPFYLTGLRYQVEGRPAVIVMGFDITKLKQAQAAIQASEARFRSIFERANIGIALADTEGTLTAANDALAQLLGYSRESLRGGNISLFTHPDDLAVEAVHLRGLAQNLGDSYRMDKRYITRSGQILWVDLLVTLLRDGEGKPAQVLGMVVDITERKRAEKTIQELNEGLERRVQERTAELAASNQELESFSYSVSHDLRAPLRAMNGFSHLLQAEYGSRIDARGLDYLARIRGASKRMGELIDNLLQMARLSRLELRREPIDLTALTVEIRDTLREQSPDRPVEWRISSGLRAHADPVLAKVLLDNLLRNAWKFTAERPLAQIEVFAEQHGSETAFCVRDNGAGFPMQYAEQLFKPFQRLHDAQRFEGTGIGLAIVHRIVRRHGGRVWARSAEEQGASFYFTLL